MNYSNASYQEMSFISLKVFNDYYNSAILNKRCRALKLAYCK